MAGSPISKTKVEIYCLNYKNEYHLQKTKKKKNPSQNKKTKCDSDKTKNFLYKSFLQLVWQ